MKIRYYKDSGRSYMVIHPDEMANDDYQYRMLSQNIIQGILPYNIRNINNESYLYYETSGQISLEDRFGSGRIRACELRRMLHDLKEVHDTLKTYLLDEEQLLLRPDCVYVNPVNGRYSFAFYVREREPGELLALTEWMLDRIDPSDQKAVGMLYDVCTRAQATGVSLGELLDAVQEEDEPAQECIVDDDSREHNRGDRRPKKDGLLSENGFSKTFSSDILYGYTETGSVDNTMEQDRIGHSRGTKQMTEGVNRPRSKHDRKHDHKFDRKPDNTNTIQPGYLIMALLFGLTFAAVLYLRSAYDLTKVESVLSAVVAIVSLVMTAVSILSVREKDPKKKVEKSACDFPEAVNAFYEQERLFQKNAMQDDVISCDPAIYTNHGMQGVQSMQNLPNTDGIFMEDADTQTELLCASQMRQAPRLYSRNTDTPIRIDLSELPLTVGKLPGVADVLLKKEGVSRLHVRFFKRKDADGIYMKDLNSTNGTFRNGHKVRAEEEVALHAGDEIRIGQVEFEYV